MSDFVSGFWSIYVTVLSLLSIIGCAVLLKANSIKRTGGPAQLHGHVWDEDLREYNNPLPRWWIWLFYITIAFGLLYLAAYPGLGSNPGGFGWSAKKQYEDEMSAANAKYAPIFDKYLKQDVMTVAADPDARQMGERLYLTYCAQCHGSDAQGAKGFPNLTDKDWLWGGEAEQIKTSIAEGRNGVMPPFGHLGADSIKDLASYVRSLSSLAADPLRVQRGKELFQQNCIACHGPEAKGQVVMGAPNLTDGTWLYGSSSEATITETITKGRNNRMPAHRDFLGEGKVHLLAGYVFGLSHPASKK